ncbi:sigma-70 family RNA polymerase sigma factor [Aquibium carbonis]|uniref:Sigma-70 family RNA polymerase sigma factor n=1 Tax=Aquibium carbonis TaxID=2495581 RepID=A0A429Z2Z7_9HYPH|nr:sigma-70 family RNA polymerase sigma factor [Aquibium carbonis]RST88048.1 sigma-70 family RNA polymerase sigma factor [Aquibium carbonis]
MLDAARLHRLRGLARRYARGSQDADDLLQDALIVAIGAGRLRDRDLDAWLIGVMRNIAATTHRGAARRAQRETAFASVVEHPSSAGLPDGLPANFVGSLPPSLRLVAMLAGAGATRAEIRHIIGTSDMALRQRIGTLKARWRVHLAVGGESEGATLSRLPLPFGAIRRALLPVARQLGVALASHDPDGHLLAFDLSSARPHERALGGN